MKVKLLKKSMVKTVVLLFMLFTLSYCCPCYLQQTFTNVANVRTQTNDLIAMSGDSVKNHKAQIESTTKTIDNAIAENQVRRGCKEIGKIWHLFKNDSTGVYDLFITDWTKNKTLPQSYSNSMKEDMNKILDQIEAGEKAIKEKKKPCNN
jgi:hypothetical protein